MQAVTEGHKQGAKTYENSYRDIPPLNFLPQCRVAK